jgi:hypothetical protein
MQTLTNRFGEFMGGFSASPLSEKKIKILRAGFKKSWYIARWISNEDANKLRHSWEVF